MKDAHALAMKMVKHQLRDRGIGDPAVLEAMTDLPRHLFVPSLSLVEAYADKAQPTAEGQTISQPYMVALMTQLLEVKPERKVLEVGTGSGYQTAILAKLAGWVVTIEKSQRLSEFARTMLGELELDRNVDFVVGDGTLGWPKLAPYDRILVTAAAPRVPQALKQQLADGGRIVVPEGDRSDQQLRIYDLEQGRWKQSISVGCRFVPLIGEQGWAEE